MIKQIIKYFLRVWNSINEAKPKNNPKVSITSKANEFNNSPIMSQVGQGNHQSLNIYNTYSQKPSPTLSEKHESAEKIKQNLKLYKSFNSLQTTPPTLFREENLKKHGLEKLDNCMQHIKLLDDNDQVEIIELISRLKKTSLVETPLEVDNLISIINDIHKILENY